jgi:hypothetical protein
VPRIRPKVSGSIWAFSARLSFSQASRSPGRKAQQKVEQVSERIAFSCLGPTSLVNLLHHLRTDLTERFLHLVLQRRWLDATGF